MPSGEGSFHMLWERVGGMGGQNTLHMSVSAVLLVMCSDL